jgi:hypothetical protein
MSSRYGAQALALGARVGGESVDTPGGEIAGFGPESVDTPSVIAEYEVAVQVKTDAYLTRCAASR